MNKIYKLVWSKVRNAWVVASEIAKGHGKNASATRERKLLKTAVITAIMGGCLMTGGLASAALTEEQQAVYDAVMAELNQKADDNKIHYLAIGPDNEKNLAKEGNYNNDGVEQHWGIAIGVNASSKDGDGIALGVDSRARGNSSTGLGSLSSAVGDYSTATGHDSQAFGDSASAFGALARAYGANGVAIGGGALVANSKALTKAEYDALSEEEKALYHTEKTRQDEFYQYKQKNDSGEIKDIEVNGVAVGNFAKSIGYGGVSVGNFAKSMGKGGVAIGDHAKASDQDNVNNSTWGVALGAYSQNKVSQGVAIGTLSVADREKGAMGYLPTTGTVAADLEEAMQAAGKAEVFKQFKTDYEAANAKLNEAKAAYEADPTNDTLKAAFEDAKKKADDLTDQYAVMTAPWKSQKGAVSVGNDKTGFTRQITGVAAGSEDTDAVNVAQLKAVNTKVDKNKTDITEINKKITNLGASSDWTLAVARGDDSKTDNEATAEGDSTKVSGGTVTLKAGRGVKLKQDGANVQIGLKFIDMDPAGSPFNDAKAIGGGSLAVGQNSVAGAHQATAVGFDTKAGEYGVALGAASEAGKSAVAIGNTALANGEGSIAIGTPKQKVEGYPNKGFRKVDSEDAIAIGTETAVDNKSEQSTALGVRAEVVESVASAALGSFAKVQNSDYSTAVGNGAFVRNSRFGTALGNFAVVAETQGGVALGSHSLATRKSGGVGYNLTNTPWRDLNDYLIMTGQIEAYTKADAALTAAQKELAADPDNYDLQAKVAKAAAERNAIYNSWISTNGAVSIGNEANGITRQITGVAAGTQDTDAVNVAQLKALNDKVDKSGVHYFSVNSDDKKAPDGTNYKNDGATGKDAVAIGSQAQAQGTNSTALGHGAQAQEENSTALGNEAKAEGNESTALGRGAKAQVDGSVALGNNAVAGRKAGEVGYIALGGSATFEDALKTLNKKEDYDKWTDTVKASKAEYDNLTKAFEDARTKDKKAEAKAALDEWKGKHADFIEALTAKEKLEATWRATKAAVSVGADGVDTAGNKIIESRQITNVAAGTQDTDAVNVAQLKAVNTKVDKNTTDITELTTKIKNAGGVHYFSVNANESAKPEGTNWNNDGAKGADAIAVGPHALAQGNYSTVVGPYAQAVAKESSVFGVGANASGVAATAAGAKAKAMGIASTATGSNAVANGKTASAFGSAAKATWTAATAVGSNAVANGVNASAFGAAANATGVATTALGVSAQAKSNESVAVGAYSVADREKGKIGYALGGDNSTLEKALESAGQKEKYDELTGKINPLADEYNGLLKAYLDAPRDSAEGKTAKEKLDAWTAGHPDFLSAVKEKQQMTDAWQSGNGAVSVGKAGATRQITNVAAGSEDTDAVNVAQLKAVNTKVDKNTTDITELTTKIKNAGGVHYFSVNGDDSANPKGTNFNNDGAKGGSAIAAGRYAGAQGDYGTAVGSFAQAGGEQSSAFGVAANASGVAATAAGNNAKAMRTASTATGSAAIANGEIASAFGSAANATRTAATAVGSNTIANGEIASAFGSAARATGRAATAVGSNAVANEKTASAFGSAAKATGVGATALGFWAQAKSNESVAVGAYTVAEKHAAAIGPQAKALGEQSVAVGGKAEAQAAGSLAIGSLASAIQEGGVALGRDSLADRQAGVWGFDASAGKAMNEDTLLGEKKAERAQEIDKLNGLRGELQQLRTEFEESIKKDPVGQDGKRIPSDATKQIQEKLKNKTDEFDAQFKLVNGYVNAWQSIDGAVSIGNEATGITRQLTGVAAGTKDTDAVNVAQLRNVATTPMNFYFGGKTENNVYTPGTANWSMPLNDFRMDFGDGLKAEQVTDKDGKKYTLVTLDKDSLKNDPNFKGPQGEKGETGAKGDKGDTGLQGPQGEKGETGAKGADGKDGKSAYDTWKEQKGNEGKTEKEFLEGLKGKDGVDGKDGAKGADGKSAYEIWKEKPGNEGKSEDDFLKSLKGKDGKDGTGTGGASVEAGKNISVDKKDPAKSVVSLKDDITVKSVTAGGVTINKDGINANGQKITGVAPGTISKDSTDAVNGSQLFATNQMVVNNMNQINNLRDESREGDAMGAAMAALKPLDFDPYQRSQVMAGIGHYKGKEAVALGLVHYNNEDLMIHGGLAFAGNSDVMANVGVTYRFGRSDEKHDRDLRMPQYEKGPITSVYILQDEVQSLKRENDAIRKENKEAKDRIAALEAKLEQVLEKVK